MKRPIFSGSGVAIVTPFNGGIIDFDAYTRLLNFHLKNGTDAIIVAGTTGEASTLSVEEHARLVDFTIKMVNHAIPVIAGTSSNDTRHMVELSKNVDDLGVDGLLITPPYYNKTSQKGLILHIEAVAKDVKAPIILYNIPSRTGGLGYDIETLKILSEIPNVMGVKEATGDMSVVAKIKGETDLVVYAGNDDVVIPTLALGGEGVISVIANILPLEVHEICQEFFEGKIESSRIKFLKMFNLIKALFVEVNPIPIKAAMKIMNLANDEMRLPLTEIATSALDVLKDSMEKYGLIF